MIVEESLHNSACIQIQQFKLQDCIVLDADSCETGYSSVVVIVGHLAVRTPNDNSKQNTAVRTQDQGGLHCSMRSLQMMCKSFAKKLSCRDVTCRPGLLTWQQRKGKQALP